jgi:hypothetical protein
MAITKTKRLRLSIDVDPEEHRKIKISAIAHNETIREYVVRAVKERLSSDLEYDNLLSMTAQADPVLAELWDNEKDSVYDNL